MIEVQKARDILGKDKTNLTDEQVQNILYLLYNLVSKVVADIVDN